MATLSQNFESEHRLDLFLKGGLLLRRWEGPTYLSGLSLTFVQPSATTVTFATSPQQPLTLAQLRTAIQTALATVRVRLVDGYLAIVEVTPTNGVAFGTIAANHAEAPTRKALGISLVAQANVPKNAPSGAVPRWLSKNVINSANTLLTYEV